MTKKENKELEAYAFNNVVNPYRADDEAQKLREIQRKEELELFGNENNNINQTIKTLENIRKKNDEIAELTKKAINGTYWTNHFIVCQSLLQVIQDMSTVEELEKEVIKSKFDALVKHFNIGMSGIKSRTLIAENFVDPYTFLQFFLKILEYLQRIFEQLKTCDTTEYVDGVRGPTAYQNESDIEHRRKQIALQFQSEYMNGIAKALAFSIPRVQASIEEYKNQSGKEKVINEVKKD